jgi:hypothetical protein
MGLLTEVFTNIDRPSNALQGLFVDGLEGLKRGWSQKENYDFEQMHDEELAKKGYYERGNLDRLKYVGFGAANLLADPINLLGIGLVQKGVKSVSVAKQLATRLKFKKSQLDAGVISKAEYDLLAKDIEFLKKNPQLLKADTLYHGTSTPIKELSPDMISTGTFNLYGTGLYTTMSKGTANIYTKRGKGGKPTLYKVIEKKPDAPSLNLETTPATFGKEVLGEMFPDSQLRGMSLRKGIDEFRAESGEWGIPAHEVIDLVDNIFDKAYEQGYKSVTHYGGMLSKSKPHTVKIFIHPATDIKKLKETKKGFSL